MNKMFKKIFAVVAACATVATMSVSAFAATATHDNGTVSVTGYTEEANQYTVMVFKVAADTEDLAKAVPASVNDIYYINQGSELYDEVDKDGLLDKMLVKATDGENALPAGSYAVRIGNDANTVVTLGLTIEEETTVLYGDVDGDNDVDTSDAVLALRASMSAVTLDDTAKKAADVDGVVGLSTSDAVYILRKGMNAIDKFPVEK